MEIKGKTIKIITGRYGKGTPEENEKEKELLSSVLERMGVNVINIQQKETFIFPTLNEDGVVDILSKSIEALNHWGVSIPNIRHSFDNNPNKHMIIIND